MAGPVLIPAASVILLGDAPLQVLMILRHESSSFAPGVWVFPGGALDPEDGPPGRIESFQRAAVREVMEETAIALTTPLVPTSRWITPEGMPRQFDTWFFLAAVPPGCKVRLQESEAVDYTWIGPQEALRRNQAGDFPMVFPTIRNLHAIAAFTSGEELIRSRRGATIEAVQPILVVEGNQRKIVLP